MSTRRTSFSPEKEIKRGNVTRMGKRWSMSPPLFSLPDSVHCTCFRIKRTFRCKFFGRPFCEIKCRRALSALRGGGGNVGIFLWCDSDRSNFISSKFAKTEIKSSFCATTLGGDFRLRGHGISRHHRKNIFLKKNLGKLSVQVWSPKIFLEALFFNCFPS